MQQQQLQSRNQENQANSVSGGGSSSPHLTLNNNAAAPHLANPWLGTSPDASDTPSTSSAPNLPSETPCAQSPSLTQATPQNTNQPQFANTSFCINTSETQATTAPNSAITNPFVTNPNISRQTFTPSGLSLNQQVPSSTAQTAPSFNSQNFNLQMLQQQHTNIVNKGLAAVSGKSYSMVETPDRVEAVCKAIQMSFPHPILGLDCEGLIKGQPIALIQLSFQGHAYIFDLMKVDPFDHTLQYNLKQVLTSHSITKIFHDFCEDCSALINSHGIYCNRVFDTQIAHRVISDATKHLTNACNQNQIGLNALLQEYLGAAIQNEEKVAIASQMKTDETFWHTMRPLSEQMLEYAAQDVIFLPLVYEVMEKYLPLPYSERYTNARGEVWHEIITILQKILNDTQKCLSYATINNEIKDLSSLQKGREILAFIKNYQKDIGIIFCSLNIKVSGIIRDPPSIEKLVNYNSFGDIVYVILHGFSEKHKGRAILSYSRQFNSQVPPSIPGYPISLGSTLQHQLVQQQASRMTSSSPAQPQPQSTLNLFIPTVSQSTTTSQMHQPVQMMVQTTTTTTTSSQNPFLSPNFQSATHQFNLHTTQSPQGHSQTAPTQDIPAQTNQQAPPQTQQPQINMYHQPIHIQVIQKQPENNELFVQQSPSAATPSTNPLSLAQAEASTTPQHPPTKHTADISSNPSDTPNQQSVPVHQMPQTTVENEDITTATSASQYATNHAQFSSTNPFLTNTDTSRQQSTPAQPLTPFSGLNSESQCFVYQGESQTPNSGQPQLQPQPQTQTQYSVPSTLAPINPTIPTSLQAVINQEQAQSNPISSLPVYNMPMPETHKIQMKQTQIDNNSLSTSLNESHLRTSFVPQEPTNGTLNTSTPLFNPTPSSLSLNVPPTTAVNNMTTSSVDLNEEGSNSLLDVSHESMNLQASAFVPSTQNLDQHSQPQIASSTPVPLTSFDDHSKYATAPQSGYSRGGLASGNPGGVPTGVSTAVPSNFVFGQNNSNANFQLWSAGMHPHPSQPSMNTLPLQQTAYEQDYDSEHQQSESSEQHTLSDLIPSTIATAQASQLPFQKRKRNARKNFRKTREVTTATKVETVTSSLRTSSFTPRETPNTNSTPPLESSNSASNLTEQTTGEAKLKGIPTHQRIASVQAAQTSTSTSDLQSGEKTGQQLWNAGNSLTKMPENIFANVAAADNTFVPREESIALSRELATEIAQSIFKKAVTKNAQQSAATLQTSPADQIVTPNQDKIKGVCSQKTTKIDDQAKTAQKSASSSYTDPISGQQIGQDELARLLEAYCSVRRQGPS